MSVTPELCREKACLHAGFPTRSNTNKAIQPLKRWRLEIFDLARRGACTIYVAETSCAFVLAHAKSRFSHDTGHIKMLKKYVVNPLYVLWYRCRDN